MEWADAYFDLYRTIRFSRSTFPKKLLVIFTIFILKELVFQMLYQVSPPRLSRGFILLQAKRRRKLKIPAIILHYVYENINL